MAPTQPSIHSGQQGCASRSRLRRNLCAASRTKSARPWTMCMSLHVARAETGRAWRWNKQMLLQASQHVVSAGAACLFGASPQGVANIVQVIWHCFGNMSLFVAVLLDVASFTRHQARQRVLCSDVRRRRLAVLRLTPGAPQRVQLPPLRVGRIAALPAGPSCLSIGASGPAGAVPTRRRGH